MFARLTAVVLLMFCFASPLPTHASEIRGEMAGAVNVAKLDDRSDFTRPVKPDILRELKVREKYEYYDINGTSLPELRKEMRQHGTKWNDGKVYAALTTWDIRYDFDFASSNDAYTLKSVSTDIDIVFHFPRRLENAAASHELVSQWDQYMEHLTVHEMGHKDLAVKAAAEINEKLAGLGSFSSKAELRRAADRIVNDELKRMKEIQVAYDAETQHGIKQGAILPDQI